MIKKIEILGIAIDNYPVQESMLRVETFLNSTIMNIIETVSMEMLVKAEHDEKLRDCIQNLDLAIIGEKEILQAAGVGVTQRVRETTERRFFTEFMKRIIRNNQRVYLFSNTRQQLEELQLFLQEHGYGKMKITGSSVAEECQGDFDGLINDINIESPNIILSVLPSPEQEYFLMQNKEKINAKLWYGIGIDYKKMKGVFFMKGWIKRMFHKTMLRRMLSKYPKGE